MTDIFDKATRSRIMSRIRGKDTKIELEVRRNLHRLGLRYRLHVKWLPGKPDLVFPKYKTVVAVNGCWWHQHDCGRFKMPKSNLEFWERKIQYGKENEAKKLVVLKLMGWRVITVWECEIRNGMDWEDLARRIKDDRNNQA